MLKEVELGRLPGKGLSKGLGSKLAVGVFELPRLHAKPRVDHVRIDAGVGALGELLTVLSAPRAGVRQRVLHITILNSSCSLNAWTGSRSCPGLPSSPLMRLAGPLKKRHCSQTVV